MTRDEFKKIIEENNLTEVCFLNRTNYTTTPNTCGVYKEGMFYYLYFVDEYGNVNIVKKTKKDEECFDFLMHYLGLVPRQNNVVTHKLKREVRGNKNGKRN